LLSDPAEAARLSREGLREVARFDRAAVLEGYLLAYRDALAGSRSPPSGISPRAEVD